MNLIDGWIRAVRDARYGVRGTGQLTTYFIRSDLILVFNS